MIDIHAIAAQLEAAKHEPDHVSYKAFCRETVWQFRSILFSGIRLKQVSGTITGTSDQLFSEVESGQLTIAVDGSPMLLGHPLAEYLPEFGATLNTVFRAVHDYYGHYRTRSPFETFEGEIAAYKAHKRMYSPIAQKALFGETIAQLCHYYAHGDFVPVQKCAILPEFSI